MRGLRTHCSDVWKGALSVCRKRMVDMQAYVDYNVMLASHVVFCLLHVYIIIHCAPHSRCGVLSCFLSQGVTLLSL